MGSFILCHKKKATQPYHIARIHCKIYTLEELCYFLSNNLYLIDYTIMNQQLFDWIAEELELIPLADSLREMVSRHASMEQFVMEIFSYASIYTAGELAAMEQVLERLKNQKVVEKKKLMADNLLENGAIRQAIGIYRSILYDEPDESVEKKFYGNVYANLGAAYGRMFLYREAAKMYEAAYQICEQTFMLKAYLYACRKSRKPEEYQDLLAKSEVYRKLDEEIASEIREEKETGGTNADEELLEQWKEEYRKIAF